MYIHTFFLFIQTCCLWYREETEIIEGEVVEIQIDRPATTTVSGDDVFLLLLLLLLLFDAGVPLFWY